MKNTVSYYRVFLIDIDDDVIWIDYDTTGETITELINEGMGDLNRDYGNIRMLGVMRITYDVETGEEVWNEQAMIHLRYDLK